MEKESRKVVRMQPSAQTSLLNIDGRRSIDRFSFQSQTINNRLCEQDPVEFGEEVVHIFICKCTIFVQQFSWRLFSIYGCLAGACIWCIMEACC